jgi:hypothetical protein
MPLAWQSLPKLTSGVQVSPFLVSVGGVCNYQLQLSRKKMAIAGRCRGVAVTRVTTFLYRPFPGVSLHS